MAKLPIPQRGQPLDVSLVYDIITSINDLYTTTSQRGSTYASLATPMAGVSPADKKVNETKFVTGYIQFNQQTVTSGGTLSFSYNFPGLDFKYPPVVTATLNADVSNSPAAKKATVMLTNITTSRVEGQVNFPTLENSQTSFAGGITLIAIGQPI